MTCIAIVILLKATINTRQPSQQRALGSGLRGKLLDESIQCNASAIRSELVRKGNISKTVRGVEGENKSQLSALCDGICKQKQQTHARHTACCQMGIQIYIVSA